MLARLNSSHGLGEGSSGWCVDVAGVYSGRPSSTRIIVSVEDVINYIIMIVEPFDLAMLHFVKQSS